MKKIIISVLMLAMGGMALADGNSQTLTTPAVTLPSGNATASGANGSATTANSGSVAGASNQIGCLINCADQTDAAKITADAMRDVASTTQVIKNTPSVNGPALTTSNDTCMGSTSGSVNIAGLGVGGGTSWVDNNCKMLKNSRELWNMGMKAAAMALMCTDVANKEALELTGFVCPQTAKAEKDAKAATATSDEKYTDPIVRARLGLKPLSVASK